MSEEIARIQTEIEEAKATLAENLSTLERKARELTDWRVQVARHPFGATGAGLLGGFVLALMLDKRRVRYVKQEASPEGTVAVAGPSFLENPVVSRVMDALVAVAAAKAASMLDDLMPGEAAEVGKVDVGP